MSSELRVSSLYLILALLWILLSDWLLATLTNTEALPINLLQSIKGMFFVGFTAAALYVLLRREFHLRRHSERVAREGEAQFRYLFANNPLPMWVYDLDNLRFLDVNRAAVDQYGYSREEFLSMTIADIRPPEDVPHLIEHLKQERPILQHSGPWRHLRKNGQIIDVEIVSHMMVYQGRRAALVVAQNITEKLHALTELEKTTARLQALVQSSPLAIFVLDVDGRVKMWNPAAERMFGWDESEVLGQILPVVPPDKREEFDQLRQRVFDGESIIGIELDRVKRDGTPMYLAVSTAPLRYGGGEVREIMSVVADITERRRMEADRLEKERLRLALNKEMELRNLRERFMSTVSHEFRNPLAVIATSSDILERYADRVQPEARQQHFQNIRREIKRLTEMLDDILTLLRAESLSVEFNPMPLELVGFCSSLIEEAGFNPVNGSRVRLTASVPEIRIRADAKLLRHAIANLIGNAIKYSQPDSLIQFDLWMEDQRVGLRVRDQGIGIPPENLKRIFEPFYRADNTRNLPGTGLGLAITKQAIELHNGTIEVESSIGEGTTFTVYLPQNIAT